MENEPLKIFMALSDVERGRVKPLEMGTIDRLAREYRSMSAQYPLFSEAPTVSDKTIIAYLDTAKAINVIHDPALKGDAAGTMQALMGLWQICLRQESIALADADATLAALLEPFAKVQNERDIFDGGRAGVKLLLTATHSPANLSMQDRMVDLLAGGTGTVRTRISRLSKTGFVFSRRRSWFR